MAVRSKQWWVFGVRLLDGQIQFLGTCLESNRAAAGKTAREMFDERTDMRRLIVTTHPERYTRT